MTTTLCTRCGAAVESPQLHERWHDDHDDMLRVLVESHQGLNDTIAAYVERLHVIEQAIDGGPEDVYDDDEETLLRQAAEAHSHGA